MTLEKGFFHPGLGYWQAIDDVPTEILTGYPYGTIEVPLRPSAEHRYVDGAWVHVPQPVPTPEELRERMPVLTARQLRLGLVAEGRFLVQVDAAINVMPEGAEKEAVKIEWEYATSFRRKHPLIATIGTALGLSDAQIDNLWLAAADL
ncbi:hypothetical protein AB4Z34_31680 [Ensifer sp. 2YAB10]|uniref:hypothetical protein n=1 Tax=unclassified Ensifer TaxID=2633371 RepID=UPI001A4CE941|nr:hypothetical protein [Ensifer sp. SSB1]MBK5571663.1 hypothetical protein [Ensifer sp. SSB1]